MFAAPSETVSFILHCTSNHESTLPTYSPRIRGGNFYRVDTQAGRRISPGKPMKMKLFKSSNLVRSDNGVTTRTWQRAIRALTATKHGANKGRSERVEKDKALVALLPKVIIENPWAKFLIWQNLT